MLDLKNERIKRINYVKLVIVSMLALLGLVSMGTMGAQVNTVEARTVLPAIRGGKRYLAHNSAGTPYLYKFILGSNSDYGYLPDITNLGKYGYSNKGWGINTPGKNERIGGVSGDTHGGRTMTHSVFPRQTGFVSYRGEDYLRIVGAAVMPEYFHHTADNHQVAILTREKNKSSSVKLWKASLIRNTSASASHDYGYGIIDNLSDWKATAYHAGSGNLPIHVTNDPYPVEAQQAYGLGDSRYFDRGNINLLNDSYNQGINRLQVSKLVGLGQVGAKLTRDGNYILDYAGFGVDIPLSKLIDDGSKITDFEFNIVMTMTTPNNQTARVVGQPLGIPGVPIKQKDIIDTDGGNRGTIELKQSNLGNVKYTPEEDLQRNFKKTSSFNTREHHSIDTLVQTPTNSNFTRNAYFDASNRKPRMVGFGFTVVPLFNETARNQINTTSGRASADFVAMNHSGRGEMWVGWTVRSISTREKVYTTVGGAYNSIPTATMRYTPTDTNVKPVIIRHRIVKNNNFSRPEEPFHSDVMTVKKGGNGVTVRPITGTALSSLGTNMRYLGQGRVGTNTSVATMSVDESGVYYTNNELYSSQMRGTNAVYIDLYYSEKPDNPDRPGYEDELGELTLRERHRPVGTSNNIAGTAIDHKVNYGSSQTVSSIRPYGYTYAGYHTLAGSRRNSTSVTVTNNREGEDWTQWALFYYNLRRYNYNVEHRNIETNNKIEHNTGGYITSTDPEKPTRVTVRPLRGNDLPDGYTYANRYRDINGSTRTGSSYTITYDDETNNPTIVFYYDWNEPEETTKRIQGDVTTQPLNPVDTYLNAGVVTERDAQGVIVDEDLQATTSAVYDTYEAPIAIVPVQTTLNFYGEGGLLTGTQTSRNTDRRIYNDEFLNSLRVDSRIGSSSDVARGSQTSIYLGTGTSTHTNIAMSTRQIDNMEDLQEEAVGRSGATENNRERDYVGRWLDANSSINTWTPLTTGNYTSLQASTRDEDSVNDVVRVEAEIEYEVYNRMRHNYIPRVGSDGLEYYEYRGSDFLRGYYNYNGNTRGSLVSSVTGSRVVSGTELNVSDIVTDEYIDAEGFNVGAGQIAPVQFKIASELFDDGGSNIVGYRAETIGTSQAINPIVRQSDTNYRVIPTTRDTRLDYYEEFAYVPYHIEDELLTQQAVPVGGRLVYVNPYDYMTFPTVSGNLPVMEQNGILATEIQSNVNNFNSSGVHDSELGFDPTHSGYYMSEVDNFEEFKNSIADVEEVNRNYMQEVLRSEKEHNPELTGNDELETRGYRAYNDNIRGIVSRYSRVGSVESATNFNKRLPVTYIHNVREFMLDDVVAVGKDSGYPIVSNSETINEDYITRYTNDLGVAPSDSDKLITTNSGSIYLLPLERENGHKLSDEYYTRLFVNGIGISQFNLVDDDILTYKDGKYLFGTGDNTIYSGERKEVEVGGEDFNDEEHTINPTATPEERGYINGGRRSNNSELNDAVLDDE